MGMCVGGGAGRKRLAHSSAPLHSCDRPPASGLKSTRLATLSLHPGIIQGRRSIGEREGAADLFKIEEKEKKGRELPAAELRLA
jgi:hypothetical protein